MYVKIDWCTELFRINDFLCSHLWYAMVMSSDEAKPLKSSKTVLENGCFGYSCSLKHLWDKSTHPCLITSFVPDLA